MDKICAKRALLVENRKSEHHHWILHIQISLGTKFSFKLKNLLFWIKFIQIECFHWKTENWYITIEFCIFALALAVNFILRWQFLVLDQIYQNRAFQVENRKCEGHHLVLHIWISLSTKFHLKPTFLIFWAKVAKDVYFQSKREKVNTTMEFYKFELVSNSRNIWDKLQF